MFDVTQHAPVKARWDRHFWEPLAYGQLDDARAELLWLESQAARIRARQADILAWLSEKKVADLEAARSLEEWTAANLDVAPTTARDLAAAARTRQRNRELTRRFEAGEVTFDRAVAVANLIRVGGDDTEVAASYDQDLSGVRRRTAELKRITPVDETEIVRRRHVTLTPTLDHTAWHIAGMLHGHEGHLVARALQLRADQFPDLPGGGREGLAERQADALTALAMDWLDASDGIEADQPMGGGTEITVFVDAADLARSEGSRGATISCGPRIGPATLDRLLCGGRVGLVSLDAVGRPVAVTDHTQAIPPAVRAAVLNRDKGCVIDGCRSRYRLQVHHIRQRSHGGDHDVGNLVTLCWYHHHIAVHRRGHYFEDDTPPQRRRLSRRPRAPNLAA
jgi:hypothetical protein